MRKFTISLLLLSITSIVSLAQTTGELSVSVSTSSTGGNYAPRNILAIWIEDSEGNFIKTLLAYADRRMTHLNKWQASTNAIGSEFNTTDAITGATKSSHTTRICGWNGTDYNGTIVSDGSYTVWMELTDKNSTGNFSSFPFTKNENPNSQTPSNKPSFSSISIEWNPSGTVDSRIVMENDKFEIFPNPTNGIVNLQGTNLKEIEIRTISGKLLLKSNSQIIDISQLKNGIYLFSIITDNGITVKKLIKN